MKCAANDKSFKALRKRVSFDTTRFIIIIVFYVLADKYRFGKTKLKQILRSVESLTEEIQDSEIKLEELADVLRDEYDINFSGNGGLRKWF